MGKRKEEKQTTKIGTRITLRENAILSRLAVDAGFSSSYSLLRYLVFVFVRAASEQRGTAEPDIPSDIIRIFVAASRADARLIGRSVAALRLKCRVKPLRLFPTVDDDVADIFAECQQMGADFGPSLRLRL